MSLDIQRLFDNYLAKNNCKNLHIIKSKYSRVDAIFDSGSTTAILEHKRRDCPIYKYPDTILEKEKFESLINASKLFDCPVFYCVEFDEFILLFDVTNKNYNWSILTAPKFYGSNEMIEKEVTYLTYDSADFIISKKSYNRGGFELLNEYIKRKTI